MKLFDKRPLSLILCIMLGGLVFFTRGNDFVKYAIPVFAIGLIIIYLFSLILHSPKTILLTSGIALVISMLFSNLYFNGYFYAANRFDDEVSITATIVEIQGQTSYSSGYIIETDDINGEPFTRYKLSLYLDSEESEQLTVGSVISFKCELESFDDSTYLYSKGVSASCENVGDFCVIGEESVPIESHFSRMRENIARHAIMLSDYPTGSMISALLLGERDMLSDDLYLDFKRIGITHMLALSGMHLAILGAGLEKLLKVFGCPKNARVITPIIFTVLYMSLTGFPVSIMRAGFMMILSSLLYLLDRDSDSVTSLCISVFIICLLTPYAIYDISLWLSAFATLGVIVYAEYSGNIKCENKLVKFLKAVLASVLFSVFAIIPTLPITIEEFNGISVISPISTTLFAIPIQLIMYLGALTLLIGTFLPIGMLVSPLVSLVTDMANSLSSPDVYVSNQHPLFVVAAYSLTTLFFLFIIIEIKNKKRTVAFITAVFCIVLSIAFIMHNQYAKTDSVIYSSEDKQDMIFIMDEQESCLINASAHSKSTGYNCIDFLQSHDVFCLDKYILTHYSYKSYEHLYLLLSNIPTSEIHLPTPENEEERTIYNRISKLQKDFSTKIIVYTERISHANYKISMSYHQPYGEGTAKAALYFYDDNTTYSYISSGMLNSSTENLAEEMMAISDVIVFGSFGEKYKNHIYFEAECSSVNKIIFGSKNLFISQDDYIEYDKNGCKIYSHPSYVKLSAD